MKKLIMAATIALAAIGANAATVDWVATKGYLYDGKGTDSVKITSGSAYLMYVTAAYTQTDLVSAYYAANGDASATLTAMGASGAMATGAGTILDTAKIEGSSTSTLAGADGSAYFVVFNGDKMFVSDVADAEYDTVQGKSYVTFATISTASKLSLDEGASYTSTGWYTAAVPEPTSGLLLLVGAAMLALKRKRA